MRIELEKADRETEQGVKSGGDLIAKARALASELHQERKSAFCKAVTHKVIEFQAATTISALCKEVERLRSASPSDTEELFTLRAEVAAQKRLLKVSQDLLIDVLDSRAAQRFSTIGLSRMKSHIEDLRELLNPKD